MFPFRKSFVLTIVTTITGFLTIISDIMNHKSDIVWGLAVLIPGWGENLQFTILYFGCTI